MSEQPTAPEPGPPSQPEASQPGSYPPMQPPAYPPPGYAGTPPPGYPPPSYPPPGYVAPPYPPPGYQAYYPGFGRMPDNMGSGRYRAQGVVELIDAAFALYRRNFLLFLSISALLLVPQGLFQVGLPAILGLTAKIQHIQTHPVYIYPQQNSQAVQDALQAAGASLLLVLIVFAAQLIFGTLLQGALTQAVSQRYLGRDATFGASLKTGLSRVLQLMGLIGTYIAIYAIAFAIAAFLVITVPIVGIFVIIGLVVTMIVGFFTIWPRLQIAPTAIVVERLGPIAAIARSWRLSRGNAGRALGFYLLILLISAILSYILDAIVQGITGGSLIGGQSGSAIAALFVTPFTLIAYTLFYYDLRIRRENFDLEMLADSL